MSACIDAHQHFWQYHPLEYPWISSEMKELKRDFLPVQLKQILQQNRVQGSVAVQARSEEQETTYLLHLAEQHDFIKGVVGWVDLCASELEQRLNYFRQFPKLRGFRHPLQDEPDPEIMLSEKFLQGMGSLQKFGFTYDLLVLHHQMPLARTLAGKFPDMKFVIDHLAKPDIKGSNIREWSKEMQLFSKLDNVWCKLSGMVTEAHWSDWHYQQLLPYLEVAFETFGPDRLMFGSDWPVCLLAGDYHQIKNVVAQFSGNFSKSEQQKIWSGNAMAFYELEL